MKRRRYTIGMEIDIPLLRPDGSLHVVELKRANVPLAKRFRASLIARSTVHEAASQAVNYQRMLDEDRHDILKHHGIEVVAPVPLPFSAIPCPKWRPPNVSPPKPCAPTTPATAGSPSSLTRHSSTTPNALSTCRHPTINQRLFDGEGGDLAVRDRLPTRTLVEAFVRCRHSSYDVVDQL